MTSRGFTLIELLIVVVIIGVLAAIAIPKFNDSKRKAQVSAMKGALRTAMAGAEAHFADNNTYVGFTIPSSAPVSVTALNNTAQFVYMTAAHSSLTGVVCWVWLGDGDTGVLPGEGALQPGQIGGATCK